jgi:hypothetical protein
LVRLSRRCFREPFGEDAVGEGGGSPAELAIPASEQVDTRGRPQPAQGGQVDRVVAAQSVRLRELAGLSCGCHVNHDRRGGRPHPIQLALDSGGGRARQAASALGGGDCRPQLDITDMGTGQDIDVVAQGRHLVRAALGDDQLDEGAGVGVDDQRRCSTT